ncbi:MAG: TlyA family RNA methyltransferase [Deltaproteobacteria bacterium]|nr:TlyA family RNA methyltransferase [Deltaproteobacteria bacterium]
MKERLDKLLVSRGLAPSRERAQAYILAGLVWVEDERQTKAGYPVNPEARVEVRGKDHPYVSRGGVKLAGALDALAVDPQGMTCLDIGASTGGFTDCLLQRGAARVFAVDVGYGQLAWEIRQNPRVTVLERTNIRHLSPEALGTPVELAVMDLSFISLALVLPSAARFLGPGGLVVALVKPQFEAGREQVGRGGRVNDPLVHAQVIEEVAQAARQAGLEPLRWVPSELPGKKSGNQEFFWLLRRGEEQ